MDPNLPHPAKRPLVHGSYKTTLGGIGAILAGLGAVGKCLNDLRDTGSLDFEEVALALGMISAGWIGLTARDNKVSSEKAGAK